MTAPNCALDSAILRDNTRIWRKLGGGRIRAVMKSRGYGWGAEYLMHLLEDDVEGFCVLDNAEFCVLRSETKHPLTILGFCEAREIADMLEHGALPNVASLEELDAVLTYANTKKRTVRIRAGLSPALSWNGIDSNILATYAERAASTPYIELELWTHLTSPQVHASELQAFDAFIATFRRYGAHIAGVDVASSASLASGTKMPEGPIRIGIGLFGAFRTQIPDLRCAIKLEVDVVSRQASDASLVAGYARAPLPPGRFVEILRIGYGDGFPRGLSGSHIDLGGELATIVTIGMQHMVITHDLAPEATRTLLHPLTDIAALCAGTTTSAHELVVGLGLGAR